MLYFDYMPDPHSGTYNKGPRIWRGGLAEGWGAHGGGNILKITGSHIGNTKSTNYLWVRFPVSDQCTPTPSQRAVTSCRGHSPSGKLLPTKSNSAATSRSSRAKPGRA